MRRPLSHNSPHLDDLASEIARPLFIKSYYTAGGLELRVKQVRCSGHDVLFMWLLYQSWKKH